MKQTQWKEIEKERIFVYNWIDESGGSIGIRDNGMNRKTEESRLTYNKLAFQYDASREGQYTKFHRKELADTIDLRDGNIVLDVACGNGALLRELSKKANIQANGIDISENMIHAAKMRYPDMNFEIKPSYPLTWSEESIDLITVCCAFHHFENPREFIQECRRVLKKNGIVYLAEPNFGTIMRFFANKFWFRFSKSGDVKLYGKRELEALFVHCGFQSVQAYRKGRGLFLKAWR